MTCVFGSIDEVDWDVLTILDALRYDVAETVIEKDVKKAESPVSCTDYWLWEFVEEVNLDDVVFVSGNPRLKKNGIEGVFREDVWEWGWEEVDGVPTCPPWKVNEGFRKAYERFGPDFRYVLWYVQPHFPYIGDIKLGVDICDIPEEEEMTSSDEVTSPLREWANLFGSDTVRKAYESNAELVWNYFKKLNKEGKWVVTSDHGELLGEHDVWGHYCDKDFQQLREVPWLEIN